MPAIPKPLADHLSDVQQGVYVAEALVGVLSACGDKHWHREILIPMVESLDKVLAHVSRGLDDVTLEGVAS